MKKKVSILLALYLELVIGTLEYGCGMESVVVIEPATGFVIAAKIVNGNENDGPAVAITSVDGIILESEYDVDVKSYWRSDLIPHQNLIFW